MQCLQIQNLKMLKSQSVSSQEEMMKEAALMFDQGNYEECFTLYNQILSNPTSSKYFQVLMNRSSLSITVGKFEEAIKDCQEYLSGNKKQINPQIYVLYLNSLMKKGDIEKATSVFKEAHQIFPYHKKIADLGKLCKEKSLTDNEETYVQSMFQKLCMDPRVRQHMKDEAFLTKVERMIRNPSLTAALEKMDPRIRLAADAMLMADEN